MKIEKNCNDCTKCCEWLKGEAYGKQFNPGNPCFYTVIGKGCSIYENRPNMCKSFACEWLLDDDFPLWMKPNNSNVLIVKKIKNNIPYILIIETGQKMSVEVLNFILPYYISRNENIKYQINGNFHCYGSENFKKIIVNDE